MPLCVPSNVSLGSPRCRAADGSWSQVNFHGAWAYSAATREKVGRAYRDGHLVAISNALSEPVAEAIHAELLEEQRWTRVNQENTSNIQFSRHSFSCGRWLGLAHLRRRVTTGCPPMLSALHANLHADTGFWQQFPLGKLASWTGYTTGPMATWYQQGARCHVPVLPQRPRLYLCRPLYLGDFISPHNDMIGNRGISFVLSMTKGWERDFGGSFYWLNGQSHEMVPQFNTLILFMPSPRSIHLVSPVTYRGARQAHRRRPSKEVADASGGWQPPKARSRFAVSGWFEFDDPQAAARGAHYLAATPASLLSIDSRESKP